MTTRDLTAVASEPYCYLTTIGRRSGNPHEIEIWFTLQGGTIVLISGGGSDADWVKNLTVEQSAMVRIGGSSLRVRAALQPSDPELRWAAAVGLADKYAGEFGDPRLWVDKAFLVALDPEPSENVPGT